MNALTFCFGQLSSCEPVSSLYFCFHLSYTDLNSFVLLNRFQAQINIVQVLHRKITLFDIIYSMIATCNIIGLVEGTWQSSRKWVERAKRAVKASTTIITTITEITTATVIPIWSIHCSLSGKSHFIQNVDGEQVKPWCACTPTCYVKSGCDIMSFQPFFCLLLILLLFLLSCV